MLNIRSSKSWQKHLPHRPRRLMKSYYTRERPKLYRRVIKIFWLIVFIFLVQSIFQIRYLAIRDVGLSGQKDLTLSDVRTTLDPLLSQSRYVFFKNNNFFLLNTKLLADKLQQTYNLEEVYISKKWPHSLDVNIKEKVSHFVWQKDNEIYLLDASAAKIRPIGALDSSYLTLEDHRSQFGADNAVFAAQELDIINKIYARWQDIIGSLVGLTKIAVYDGTSWELYTSAGYFVKIDTNTSVETQLNNLARILKAGNVVGTDMNYIDLRFGDKVWFD
ncbi:MAG: hypothetical protein C3F02_04615 [Parcubacteria group bacterium]|nr:MAG: hypothetical protein C3F02_04615 [Parcubacteria group bacterium]